MNPVETGSIAALIMLAPISSSALTSSPGASLAASPSPAPHPASVVYRNTGIEIQPVSSVAADIPGDSRDTGIDADDFLASVRYNRVNNLSLEIRRTDWCLNNDRLSLSIYAPTEGMNRLLTVAKAFPGSLLDDIHAALIQTLLLLSRQQINTEFSYSIKMDSHSNFDSTIVYRLNPDAASGRPDVVASLRYSSKF